MAEVTYRSTSGAGWATSSTCNITHPSGLTAGDLMVAHFITDSTNSSVTSSNWNNIVNQTSSGSARLFVLWKIANASDVSAGSTTFTLNSSVLRSGYITAFYNTDQTTPIFAYNSAGATSSTQPYVFSGITPTANNILFIIAGIGGVSRTLTSVSVATDNPSWNEIYDSSSGGSSTSLSIAGSYSGLRTSSNSTGNVTVEWSNTGFVSAAILAIQPTAFKITADVGTFTYTGVNANTLKGFKVIADKGTFTLTGIASGLNRGFGMIASAGSFALTGISAGLLTARKLVADLGTFTLTGIASGFTKGYKIIAEAGSYILTGINAILRPSNIWGNDSKSSTTFTNDSKSSTTWNSTNKGSDVWTNDSKS